jgi:flavin-dependent dehydrogenase
VLDVAIIGGGPAGAAAALSLRELVPEASVAIFDAGRANAFKPGETLSPAATSLLASLGCLGAVEGAAGGGGALRSFGTQAAWGSKELHEHDFLYSLHGNGWRLDRAWFEEMLLGLAEEKGIEVQRGALLTASAETAGWELTFAGVARQARFVVDASGRTARFARQRGARPVVADRLAGVVVLLRSAQAWDTLVEAAEDGWWYSTSIPGNRLVVAWMSDTDLIGQKRLKEMDCWRALLAESEHTRRRSLGADGVGGPMIFPANSQRLDAVCGRGWVAAGDAAMSFDPLSSQGMTKALRSGKMASFVAADFLRGADTGERYAKLAAAEYAEYEKAKRSYYAEEPRWPEAPFWARRLSP